MTVSLVARQSGVNPNQLFTWRRLAAQGALTATGAEEEAVPASEYRALQNQVRELQRLLGKKTLEVEILKEALEVAAGPKNGAVEVAVAASGRFAVKAVADVLGVARSNLVEQIKDRTRQRAQASSRPRRRGCCQDQGAAPPAGFQTDRLSDHDRGFVYGGQVGFNWHIGRLVIGPEGELSGTDFGRRSIATSVGIAGVPFAFARRFDVDSIATPPSE